VPLRSIFKQPADPKYPRQLFLLTDGEVSDPSSCIQACKSASDSTRVFCFGIGSGASRKLVEGMAKAGGGEFEMIGDSERIDDKVLKQLGMALVPAITNVVVEWPAADVKTKAPHRHAPVFQGTRVTSFVWLNPSAKSIKVKLSAVGPNGPISEEADVDTSKTQEGDFVFALAARRMLKDFEEARSYAHTPGGSFAAGWDDSKMKKEMIKISLETNVMCQHTSFVAVEEREGAAAGEMVLRKLVQASAAERKNSRSPSNNMGAVDLLSGYGGGGNGSGPGGYRAAPPPLGGGGGGYGMAPPGAAPGGSFGPRPGAAPPMLGGGPPPPSGAAPPSPRSAGGRGGPPMPIQASFGAAPSMPQAPGGYPQPQRLSSPSSSSSFAPKSMPSSAMGSMSPAPPPPRS
jgi:hypothetical protein